jgi:hypothetical protein
MGSAADIGVGGVVGGFEGWEGVEEGASAGMGRKKAWGLRSRLWDLMAVLW